MSSEFSENFYAGVSDFSVFKFPSLDSTNVFLKNNYTLFPDFSVIYTENQTSGRGRFDRKWVSSVGKGLTFSIKIPLERIPTQNWCNITQVMALAIAQMLEDKKILPKLRWPNDIIVGGAKICGILGEVIQCNSTYAMVLGVGLNVNESKEDLFTLDRKATSLSLITGIEFVPGDILEVVLTKFISCYEKLINWGYKSLLDELDKRLYRSDSPVKVLSGNEEYTGIIAGLTLDGRIQLKTAAGIIEVQSGEITSRV